MSEPLPDNLRYAVLMKTSKGMFWLCDSRPPYAIAGFESAGDGLRHFTDGYNRNHRRGYEPSMSACINFIQFQPAIVRIHSLDDLKAVLDDPEKPTVMTYGSIAGRMTGVPVNVEKATPVWEAGQKPALITDEGYAR